MKKKANKQMKNYTELSYEKKKKKANKQMKRKKKQKRIFI